MITAAVGTAALVKILLILRSKVFSSLMEQTPVTTPNYDVPPMRVLPRKNHAAKGHISISPFIRTWVGLLHLSFSRISTFWPDYFPAEIFLGDFSCSVESSCPADAGAFTLPANISSPVTFFP